MGVTLNQGLDTITVGKIVERGKKSVDIKTRLERLSQTVSNNNTNSSLQGIQQITSDSVVTPQEKRQLAKEWEHIQAAYNSTVAMVEDLGVNPDEFLKFKAVYAQLSALMNEILADMNSSSKVDGGLEATIQAYQSAATILQNWINSYNNNVTADISSYRFEVEHTPVSPTLEDTLTFVAYIYINGVDKTQELMNANNDGSGLYPTLFQWFVKGTNDDDSLMEEIQGKRSWQISASQLSNDSIRTYFSGTVDIG